MSIRHQGCDCTSGWEGPHCEYVLGQAPKVRPNTNSSTSSDSLAIAAAVVASLTIAMAGVVVYRFYSSRIRRTSLSPSPETVGLEKGEEGGDAKPGSFKSDAWEVTKPFTDVEMI